jgi:high frequency lysogenization protein
VRIQRHYYKHNTFKDMSAIKSTNNQALALAGVFQAVQICKSLATTGRCDKEDLEPTLQSILTLEADNVVDAYGGSVSGIRRGLRVMKNQFGGLDEARDLDLARYTLSLIQLGSNVMSDDSTVKQLRAGISEARDLDFPITDPVMVNKLADLYRTRISHLSPRIMVSGDPGFLNEEKTAATIRAALLGGLRSVVLWRQCGGTRPKLVLSRAAYVRAANDWLRA